MSTENEKQVREPRASYAATAETVVGKRVSYTIEDILATLGYPDPLAAARQQARMILLGRLARYQAAIQQLEVRWGCTLKEARAYYTAQGSEDFAADDDYLQWQWYADAIETVNAKLAAVSARCKRLTPPPAFSATLNGDWQCRQNLFWRNGDYEQRG